MRFTSSKHSSLAAAAACLLTSVASAQTLPERLATCAAERNAVARLACYDELADTVVPARAGTGTAEPAGTQGAAEASSTVNAPSSSAADADRSTSTPAADPRAAEAEFGLDGERLRKAKGLQEQARLTQIVAKVAKVSERPRGELILELENGQVWVQTQARAGTYFEPGDEVTIRQGALGSYLLSGQSRPTIRVRRVK